MAIMQWVFLLSLQGCLLTHALDCTGRNVDCVSTQVTEVKLKDEPLSSQMRARRQAQLTQRPGSYSVKGSPNALLQNDRSRRHLNASKKKPNRSRIGSLSLLSHNHATSPLQVESVHRHFEGVSHPKVAALKSVKKRSRRSAPKRKKNARNNTCS
ncbi:uncharacterized protein si:dkey-12l12.1 isoform X1 [Onychostoma macrolepis]|uniref:Secreted protein n=1 Tax=Onychostoma macrolepis TaxID=369639 RepID=A0A7J6BLP3_9TELE|nr:uncharacterized protein si:dkey-12l12.1 isoform X1 [Onychostoma macrolepis]KAF4095999.1 hypothetical protein G5714_023602 [Onychostoma macrolepis]